MTKDKDQKRLIRARMDRTGESYTAARAALSRKRPPALPAAGPEKDWPALAGMSDDAVAAKTGQTWSAWVATLDAAEAHTMSHRDIAAHLREHHGHIGAWWAQTVAVGYERIRGLRDLGQSRDGEYTANKSRTFPVSVQQLYRMFTPKARSAWLEGGIVKDRKAVKDTSRRVDWEDDTRVVFNFVAKGDDKSSVSIQHTNLASRDDVEQRKAFWHERLDALKQALKG